MKKLVTLLLIVTSMLLPVILYWGSIDPFAPLHIPPIMQIISQEHIYGDLINKTPAFYVFGACISLITGISPESLIFLPIQLIPITMVVFLLFRELSASNILAALIVLIYSTLDITGNKFFFWVHGTGTILFFLIIFLLIKQLKENKAENIILIFISLIPLIYTSYDLTFSLIALLIGIMVILLIKRKYDKKNKLSQFSNILLFILIFQFALSEFVYKTLIPQFKSVENVNGIDKFIFSYLFQDSSKTNLDITIVYPKIIAILGVLKYGILLFFVIAAIYLLIRKFRYTKVLKNHDIIFLSFIFMTFLYILAKSTFGQFPIGTLFLIGIIGVSLFYRYNNNIKLKKLVISSLLAVLIINLSIFSIFYSDNFINSDKNDFEYLDCTNMWLFNNSEGIIFSDEQTMNFYYMYISKIILQNHSQLKNYNYYVNSFDPYKDIYPIINKKSRNSTRLGYFVLNKKLNFLDLEQWTTIKPWKSYEIINSNPQYDKIYDSSNVVVLY